MSQGSPPDPLAQLDLLDRYLGVRAGQYSREGQPLWLLLSCAGGDTSAALRAAQWAHAQRSGAQRLVRTLNLAAESRTMVALEQDLESHKPVAVNMLGSLDFAAARILRTIGDSAAFVLIDPFFDEGIQIDTLSRLIGRRGRRTEVLLMLRAASLATLTTEMSAERVDQVIGSSLWRRLWREDDDDANLARVSVLYRACLQRRGYAYARALRLREESHRPADHQPVFATRSTLALAMMSELVCTRRRRNGLDPQPQLQVLSERIYRFGSSVGCASTNQIVRALAGDLFGRFQLCEYRNAIAQLIDSGSIHAPARQRIGDDEQLTFNGSTQMALFDAEPQMRGNR